MELYGLPEFIETRKITTPLSEPVTITFKCELNDKLKEYTGTFDTFTCVVKEKPNYGDDKIINSEDVFIEYSLQTKQLRYKEVIK